MAYTHVHSEEVGHHVTNDGKEFGENDHLVGGEHTHEDVFLWHNRMTDQDELWSFDPTVTVTADEAAEIDAELSAVPDDEDHGDTRLQEQGSVVNNPDRASIPPVNASPVVSISGTAPTVTTPVK